ncbi:uncharacterized protein Dwil_GK10833 [Drosophila willistoni]|uniref:Pupal cuticle protein Edg-84A n=1 Tax=Drosophila willistoni TaxID=7260 RepID=B4NA96_DROWI|nr:larval cuticle protein A3A [Drosophila willistoni]EDW81783.1 uncharacterized protein Dwil_GK10833 [Drosophila willistoni]
MAFKLVAFVSCLALVSAGLIPIEQQLHHQHQEQPQLYHAAAAAAPQAQHVVYQQQPHGYAHAHAHAHEVYPDDPHPKYNFAYDVKDALSGDSKSQVESRDGDVVQGEYSLDDADGFRRTVKYTADSVNGFNAVVHREPLTHVAHKVIATPAQYHHAAAVPTTIVKTPVTYAAPSPVQTYVAPAAYHQHEAQHEQDQHQHHYATYETSAPAHETHDYYHHQ